MGVVIYKSCHNIHAFDDTYLKVVSLKKYFKKNIYTTIVCKVGVLFSSNEAGFIDMIKNYFANFNLVDFVGPIIFINTEDKNNILNETIIWFDEKNKVIKGDSEKYFYYKYFDNIVQVDKKGHFMQIHLGSKEYYCEFIPYLIKIIEAYIITQHLKLGLLPVHGGLIKNKYHCYLILGESQSGKTTLMNHLSTVDYNIISDDVVFLDLKGNVFGFGHYQKEIISQKIDSDDGYIEQIGNIKRKINKIDNLRNENCFNIDKIIITNIKKQEAPSIEKIQKKEDVLIKYLSVYPNTYFVEEDFEYGRAMVVINELCKKSIFNLYFAYNKDNLGVENLWNTI